MQKSGLPISANTKVRIKYQNRSSAAQTITDTDVIPSPARKNAHLPRPEITDSAHFFVSGIFYAKKKWVANFRERKSQKKYQNRSNAAQTITDTDVIPSPARKNAHLPRPEITDSAHFFGQGDIKTVIFE